MDWLDKILNRKKEQVETTTTTTTIPVVIDPPKPKSVMMSIIVVNNKTDKQYTINSENEFGLTWNYLNHDKGNWDMVIINQKSGESEHEWKAKGRFLDFSVVQVNWQTIESEEKKIEEIFYYPDINDKTPIKEDYLYWWDKTLTTEQQLRLRTKYRYTEMFGYEQIRDIYSFLKRDNLIK